MNAKLRVIIVLCFGITLIACSHVEPTPQSASEKRIECSSLKREMLFADANTNNEPYWRLQKQRDQLNRQYQEKNCYDILHQEKTS